MVVVFVWVASFLLFCSNNAIWSDLIWSFHILLTNQTLGTGWELGHFVTQAKRAAPGRHTRMVIIIIMYREFEILNYFRNLFCSLSISSIKAHPYSNILQKYHSMKTNAIQYITQPYKHKRSQIHNIHRAHQILHRKYSSATSLIISSQARIAQHSVQIVQRRSRLTSIWTWKGAGNRAKSAPPSRTLQSVAKCTPNLRS